MGWIDPEMVREEIVLCARNDGDFYPDAPGAAVKQAMNYLRQRINSELRDIYKEIEVQCEIEVAENWDVCPNCSSPKFDCECDYVDEEEADNAD